MSTTKRICLDFNGDLREVVMLLGDLIERPSTIGKICDPWQPRYYFEYGSPTTTAYIDENADVQLDGLRSCRYRFCITIEGARQIECGSELFELLTIVGTLPLMFEATELAASVSFDPSEYARDYQMITRRMPVEIVFETRTQVRDFPWIFRDVTQISEWRSDAIRRDSPVMCCVEPVASSHRGWSPGNQDSGMVPSQRILVYGIDENPDRRRFERDTFARVLFQRISQRNSFQAQITEIIEAKRMPFML